MAGTAQGSLCAAGNAAQPSGWSEGNRCQDLGVGPRTTAALAGHREGVEGRNPVPTLKRSPSSCPANEQMGGGSPSRCELAGMESPGLWYR